jgi:hypothetical protein
MRRLAYDGLLWWSAMGVMVVVGKANMMLLVVVIGVTD